MAVPPMAAVNELRSGRQPMPVSEQIVRYQLVRLTVDDEAPTSVPTGSTNGNLPGS